MRTYRSIAAACLVGVLAVTVAACSSDGSDEASSSTTTTAPASTTSAKAVGVSSDVPPPQVPVLGVLNAAAGTLEGDQLTLTGVEPDGVWFTDRPVRQAGVSDLDAFTDLFFSRTDPPNAAIELADARQAGDVMIVELSDPSWNAESHTLTLTAKPIDDVDAATVAAHPGLAGYVDRNDAKLPASFGANSVFLDAGSDAAAGGSDDVSALAAKLTTTIEGYEVFLDALRNSMERDPTSCGQTYLNRTLEVMSNLLGQANPAVTKMQADEAANGGELPASDGALFSEIQQNVDNAAITLQQMVESEKQIFAGDC